MLTFFERKYRIQINLSENVKTLDPLFTWLNKKNYIRIFF